KPPAKRASAKRPSAVPSATAGSPTVAPTPRAATASAAATWTALPTPPTGRMIPLPMPRASPNSGGSYDPEVQAVLVEIHRRAGPARAPVRGTTRRLDHAVGVHQREGGPKEP